MKKFLAKRKIRHPLSCDVINPKNMVVDLATTGMRWAVQFYILSMDDADYSGTTTGSPTVQTGVSGKTVLTFTGTGSYTA